MCKVLILRTHIFCTFCFQVFFGFEDRDWFCNFSKLLIYISRSWQIVQFYSRFEDSIGFAFCSKILMCVSRSQQICTVTKFLLTQIISRPQQILYFVLKFSQELNCTSYLSAKSYLRRVLSTLKKFINN